MLIMLGKIFPQIFLKWLLWHFVAHMDHHCGFKAGFERLEVLFMLHKSMLSRENLDLYAILINLIKTFGMVSNLEMYGKKNLSKYFLSVLTRTHDGMWVKVHRILSNLSKALRSIESLILFILFYTPKPSNLKNNTTVYFQTAWRWFNI